MTTINQDDKDGQQNVMIQGSICVGIGGGGLNPVDPNLITTREWCISRFGRFSNLIILINY